MPIDPVAQARSFKITVAQYHNGDSHQVIAHGKEPQPKKRLASNISLECSTPTAVSITFATALLPVKTPHPVSSERLP
ncbi:hypothetical protein LJC60_02695 [Ruminococcaceae bacterium OttesenSCG-928-D13]|nr:hypothetical protein [Ruminococcaceae bacterium OttesenSCG-928-D13]